MRAITKKKEIIKCLWGTKRNKIVILLLTEEWDGRDVTMWGWWWEDIVCLDTVGAFCVQIRKYKGHFLRHFKRTFTCSPFYDDRVDNIWYGHHFYHER
jgi:hypothetical protein